MKAEKEKAVRDKMAELKMSQDHYLWEIADMMEILINDALVAENKLYAIRRELHGIINLYSAE